MDGQTWKLRYYHEYVQHVKPQKCKNKIVHSMGFQATLARWMFRICVRPILLAKMWMWVITSHYWIWISFLPFDPIICINVWELSKRESAYNKFRSSGTVLKLVGTYILEDIICPPGLKRVNVAAKRWLGQIPTAPLCSFVPVHSQSSNDETTSL